MSGIRKSARLVTVKALCNHDVLVSIPPGELSTVGRQNIHFAKTNFCYECKNRKDVPNGQSGTCEDKGLPEEVAVRREARD